MDAASPVFGGCASVSGPAGPARVLFPALAGKSPSRQVEEVEKLRVEVSGLSQSVVSRLCELRVHQPLFEQLLGAINHVLNPRAC